MNLNRLVGNAAFSSYSGLELFDGLERDNENRRLDSSRAWQHSWYISTRAWQHSWYVLNVSMMASAVYHSFFDLLFPNSFFDQAVP